jgi:heptosyltransferase-1
MHILIVRLSSLGDIIKTYQAFYQLRGHYPQAKIYWAVEERFIEAVKNLRGLDGYFSFDFRGLKRWRLKKFYQQMRDLSQQHFDLVFDFQANFKSAIVTGFAKGLLKAGFDRKSVAEWPNLFVTDIKISAPHNLPPEERNFLIVDRIVKKSRLSCGPIKLHITKDEKKPIEEFIKQFSKGFLILCPFSAWDQKTLHEQQWIEWIQKIRHDWSYHIVICYFSEKEFEIASRLKEGLQHVALWKITGLNSWQHLMGYAKAVVAVDSASLHLASVANIPTFSLFGPTSSEVYGPIGENHSAFQGGCPLGNRFNQKCKLLRTCAAPCLKSIKVPDIDAEFDLFMRKILKK